jgi:hypothetical protein
VGTVGVEGVGMVEDPGEPAEVLVEVE